MSNRTSNALADRVARDRALDVSQSFIVRAPAGSGKTRLLIQRYLALLASVDEPEEIIAITFTRKAAAEMKKRVIDALVSAQLADNGEDTDTRRLAIAALTRDAERGWQLLANASRLRMQTIDSLNASITRQMPLLAKFGAQPESVDDASVLYRDAARSLLAQVNDTDARTKTVADDVATLLAHLDNNLAVAEELLADVLRSRDHWMRNLPAMHEREMLEATLARIRAQAVARVAALFPDQLKNETLALARFAGQNMAADGVDTGLSVFDEASSFPGGDATTMPAWLAITEFLLTKDGGWRKRVDKRHGFPTSANKEEKARLADKKNRMALLIQSLSGEGNHIAPGNGIAIALHQLRSLPTATYSEDQWRILGAIVRLLPNAVATLWNIFGRQGQCDFTEIAQAASRALGDDGAPTDLALALDYRISHLLIDEFQDTSFTQFELLGKLVRGWNHDDGRTLFLVGDPMQSIYRFREAEVGLFARAWREGVGGVCLVPLALQVNFRSCSGVVEWVNNTFSAIMPTAEDPGSGAVPYAPSVAIEQGDVQPVPSSPAVVVQPWVIRRSAASANDGARSPEPSADTAEAAEVVRIVIATRMEKPDAIIAILVRNRGHLRAIVPALQVAKIAFSAVEIDPLKGRPVVQDLLALTRAILHLGDRIAWLAVLRAPWCGLTLNDIAVLTRGALPVAGALAPDSRAIWELLNDTDCVTAMSEDGEARLKLFRDALAPAVRMQRREPLRDTVENTWLRLRGPACLARESDLDDAGMFFELLDTEVNSQGCGGQLIDLGALERRVDRLFAGAAANSGVTTTPPLQIMTIHKAKGLEFDTVIVPGLHRPPRRDDKKLIVWTEQSNTETGERELLLAPIRETGAEMDVLADSVYQYVLQRDREKQQHENVRLLYVAATRAERRLYLLGAFIVKIDGPAGEEVVPPRAESLMASLWPVVSSMHLNIASTARIDANGAGRGATATTSTRPIRLVDAQPLPKMPEPLLAGLAGKGALTIMERPAIDFEWAGEAARHVGSVVHEFLQRIAEDGVEKWSGARLATVLPAIKSGLARRGVPADDLSMAASRVAEALLNTLADSRGRWTLQAHFQARTEWRLTAVGDGGFVNIAIDRTFVDDQGVRWIIDFKTGSHEGADVDAFLDNERKRYAGQLEAYAKILGAMQTDTRDTPVKLGLYFPTLKGWREWEWKGVAR